MRGNVGGSSHSTDTPAVSVIIPSFNRLATLRRTLEAYERQEGDAAFEVLVVDDGSRDGTWEWLRGWLPRRFVLHPLQQENRGQAAARNRALARARGRWVLLVGDDILPTPPFVAAHLEAHRRPGAGRFVLGRTEWDPERPVSSVMRHITGIGAQQFRYEYLRHAERLGFRYFYGSNLSLERSTLSSTEGPFDPALRAFEDPELGYRLMRDRKEIEYRADVLAHHDHPHTLESFAERQRGVGRAAAVLIARHPEVAPLFGMKELDAAAAAAARSSRKSRSAPAQQEGIAAADIARLDAAERLLLCVFSRFGGVHARWLDRLYTGLFWYFYARALAETHLGRLVAAPVAEEILCRAVAPPLRRALRAAEATVAPEEREGLQALLGRLLATGGALQTRTRLLRWTLETQLREIHYRLRRRHAAPRRAPART
jgi:glycosyltransferase involved in cell wall biosynthesis